MAWPPSDNMDDRSADKQPSCRTWVAEAWGVDEDDYWGVPLMGIACGVPTVIPDVFLACKEAYAVAIKQYKRTFACAHSMPETYFNFERDTLYMDWENFDTYRGSESVAENPFQLDVWNGFKDEYAEDVKNIQRLAVRVPIDPITSISTRKTSRIYCEPFAVSKPCLSLFNPTMQKI